MRQSKAVTVLAIAAVLGACLFAVSTAQTSNQVDTVPAVDPISASATSLSSPSGLPIANPAPVALAVIVAPVAPELGPVIRPVIFEAPPAPARAAIPNPAQTVTPVVPVVSVEAEPVPSVPADNWGWQTHPQNPAFDIYGHTVMRASGPVFEYNQVRANTNTYSVAPVIYQATFTPRHTLIQRLAEWQTLRQQQRANRVAMGGVNPAVVPTPTPAPIPATTTTGCAGLFSGLSLSNLLPSNLFGRRRMVGVAYYPQSTYASAQTPMSVPAMPMASPQSAVPMAMPMPVAPAKATPQSVPNPARMPGKSLPVAIPPSKASPQS